MMKRCVSKAIVFLGFFLLLSGFSLAIAETEPALIQPPLLLKAYNVLPAELLEGPNYRVESRVENDGFVNIYRLTTDQGPLTVESTWLLRERINELIALKHMQELEKTEVFTNALKEGAKAPLRTVKGLVTEPVDTVTGVVTGIGRWFSDVGRSIASDDPHQENVLKTALGYAAVKRKFAYEYGIDPYTSYNPVQKALSTVAQAGFAGGLTPKLAFSAINKPVGTALRVSGTTDSMRRLVRDKSPAELKKINEEKLGLMGVPGPLVDAFLENPIINPYQETLLVGALESMPGVKGREAFIAAAVQINDDQVAGFMLRRAQMMADYHANIAKATRILAITGTPFLQRQDGALVGLFPLDQVSWTGALFAKANAAGESLSKIPGITGKELWIEGTFAPEARKALESRGWKLQEKAGERLIKGAAR